MMRVEQYNRDLAAWEQAVNGKGKTKPQQKPPERESIRKKLRDLEAEAKRRNAERRQESRHRSYDYDRDAKIEKYTAGSPAVHT